MIRAPGLELAPATATATRGECADAPRPCLRFACRHHLAVDVGPTGELSIVGGSKLPAHAGDAALDAFTDELLERIARIGSCALDVVDRNPGGLTLHEISIRLGVTRERIRQIERKATRRIVPRLRRRLGADEYADEVATGKPRPPIDS